jgi:alpha-1,2-mannosyltransferase
VASCLAIGVTTVLVVYWFIDPIARRHGWLPWYAVGVVTACAMAFDPLRETFFFGQVNMYLVALVAFDLLFLVQRGSRFAGAGIGLAVAFKLTPGVFLLYLLVTKRWRAALTACAAAFGATLVGAALAPDESRVFWTDALWNTDRVGQLDYISNQSLNGAVARLNPHEPSTLLWALAVVAVVVVWVIRVRRAAAVGDEKVGFALTGIVTCLISPITWVHHLVWIMPALLILLDRTLEEDSTRRRRRWLWSLLIVSYVILSSRIVWAFKETWTNPLVWFASNAYLWVTLALLFGVPVARAPVAEAPEPPAKMRATQAPQTRPITEVQPEFAQIAEPASRELEGAVLSGGRAGQESRQT